ncbi:MAG: hypothetical protein Q7U47_13960 [Paludibacter sp.]|nr:hypothetical protein [Paludibacter sp.]
MKTFLWLVKYFEETFIPIAIGTIDVLKFTLTPHCLYQQIENSTSYKLAPAGVALAAARLHSLPHSLSRLLRELHRVASKQEWKKINKNE